MEFFTNRNITYDDSFDIYLLIANSISFLRIILTVPALICEYFNLNLLLLIIIIFVILTDYFDGKIARLSKNKNFIGPYLDISADFVFILSMMSCLFISNQVPLILIPVIILSILSYLWNCLINKSVIYTKIGKYTGAVCYFAIINIAFWKLLVNQYHYIIISTIFYYFLILYLILSILENLIIINKSININKQL